MGDASGTRADLHCQMAVERLVYFMTPSRNQRYLKIKPRNTAAAWDDTSFADRADPHSLPRQSLFESCLLKA